MPAYINVSPNSGDPKNSGAWHAITQMFINVGGGNAAAWKPITIGYMNAGGGNSGAWKPFFTSGTVPGYTFTQGNDLYVSTNGFIGFDLGNSDLIGTDTGRSMGILPANLVQGSLRYFNDANYTYLYWTGRRSTSATSGEIAYEAWFPNGANYAYVQISFPTSTYSGTGYWYNKSQRTFSGTRTSGSQYKIWFDSTKSVQGPYAGTLFTAKGGGWASFINTSNTLTAGNTDSGYTKIITGLKTPEFDAVTTTNNGFYALITNYDATYTYNLSASAGTATLDKVTNVGRITVTGLTSGQSSNVTVYASKTGYVNSASAILSGSSTTFSTLKPTLAILSQSSNGYIGYITNYDGDHYSYTIALISTTHSPSSGVGLSFSSPQQTYFYVTGLNAGESATVTVTSKVLAGPYINQTSTSNNFTSTAVVNNPTNVSLSTSGSNYSVSWTGYTNPNITRYNVYVYVSSDGTTFGGQPGSFGYSTTGLTTSLTFAQSSIGTGTKQLYVVVYGANEFGTVGDASPNSNTINNPNYIDPSPPPALTPSATASVSGNVLTFTVSNGTPSAWYAHGGINGYLNPNFSFDGAGRTATFVNMTDGQTLTGDIEINITGYGYIYTNSVTYTQVGAPPPPPPPPAVPPPPPPFFPPAGKSVGVTTLIRTPEGLVPAGALSVGDTLLSADILGFPYENYNGATEFALGWVDNNPEIILKETSVVGITRRLSHFAVAINEDLFSDTHYILIKRGPEARFVYTAYVEPTDMVYNYSSSSWEPIYMLEKVPVDHQVVSINCEPYDIFFTENALVHDSVEI